MADELRDALNAAADADEKAIPPDDDNTDAGNKADDDDAARAGDSGDDDDDDDDDEDAAVAEHTAKEQEAAVALYRQLTNPDTAADVLNSIARRAGYELKNLSKTEQRVVKSEIESVLQDVMGDDYSVIPNLGKALEAILDSREAKSAKKIAELEAKVSKSEQTQYQQEVDKTLTWAAETFSDFTDPAMNKRILKEMRQLPPPPNADLKTYVRKMYKLAGGKSAEAAATERNSRNKTNKDGQKPSDNARGERSTKPVSSLADAVKQAYEEQFPNEK